jgi:hypothetical protein
VLEVEHVDAAQVEVVAAADRGVNVNGKTELRGDDDDVPEDEVLEPRVLVRARHAAAAVLLVDRLDDVTGRVAE